MPLDSKEPIPAASVVPPTNPRSEKANEDPPEKRVKPHIVKAMVFKSMISKPQPKLGPRRVGSNVKDKEVRKGDVDMEGKEGHAGKEEDPKEERKEERDTEEETQAVLRASSGKEEEEDDNTKNLEEQCIDKCSSAYVVAFFLGSLLYLMTQITFATTENEVWGDMAYLSAQGSYGSMMTSTFLQPKNEGFGYKRMLMIQGFSCLVLPDIVQVVAIDGRGEMRR